MQTCDPQAYHPSVTSSCLAGMVLRWLRHEYGGLHHAAHVSVAMPSSPALLPPQHYRSALFAEEKGVHSLLELETGKLAVSSRLSRNANVVRGMNQLTEHAR